MGKQSGGPPARRGRRALGLKEGDEIDIRVVGDRAFDVELDRSRERALALIRSLRKPLPPAWKFYRDEANAR